jgi:hypothetical protein
MERKSKNVTDLICAVWHSCPLEIANIVAQYAQIESHELADGRTIFEIVHSNKSAGTFQIKIDPKEIKFEYPVSLAPVGIFEPRTMISLNFSKTGLCGNRSWSKLLGWENPYTAKTRTLRFQHLEGNLFYVSCKETQKSTRVLLDDENEVLHGAEHVTCCHLL